MPYNVSRNPATNISAWVGGMVIAAGFGYTAPAAAGALLAVAGLPVLTSSVVLERVKTRAHAR